MAPGELVRLLGQGDSLLEPTNIRIGDREKPMGEEEGRVQIDGAWLDYT
jgi:hypothetical protein